MAQELVAYSNFHQQAKLYYWHREAKNSNAEVDFIILKNGEIVPIEVKSSHKGGMKSLHLFLQSHPNSKLGLKLSTGTFALHPHWVEVPLYAIEGWLDAE